MATEIEKLQKQLDRKPSMLIEARELMEIMVTKEQVKQVLDVLLSRLQEGEKRMASLVESSTSEVKDTAEKVLTDMKEARASLTAQVASYREEMKSDARTFQRTFDMKLQKVEEMIDYYDDSGLRQAIEDVRSSIPEVPEQFDASELMKQIEDQQKEIDELKKRPVGKAAGGVSDMRITQAFKNILKTEAPSGDIDGVNTTYTVTQPIFAVFAFSLNGEVIPQIPNYTISANTIEFSTALPAAYSGKDFEIKYI